MASNLLLITSNLRTMASNLSPSQVLSVATKSTNLWHIGLEFLSAKDEGQHYLKAEKGFHLPNRNSSGRVCRTWK